jgi:hypothetical protein
LVVAGREEEVQPEEEAEGRSVGGLPEEHPVEVE